jgi:hypothetical protein
MKKVNLFLSPLLPYPHHTHTHIRTLPPSFTPPHHHHRHAHTLCSALVTHLTSSFNISSLTFHFSFSYRTIPYYTVSYRIVPCQTVLIDHHHMHSKLRCLSIKKVIFTDIVFTKIVFTETLFTEIVILTIFFCLT